MNRQDFLKMSTIAGGATMMGASNAFTQNLTNNNMDKLVDANGNFVQQPLPYAENFLEPYMDSETLHYTFHHGGATKAANTDLKKLKKQSIIIISKQLTIGQRNYPITFLLIFFIRYFGQILAIK